MKHFNTLTLVENEVIRLGEMRKLLAVIVNGMEGSTREEIESSIHYIEGSLSDISDNLSTNFQCLFEEIASTNLEKASTMMSDKGYQVGSLEDIPQRDGYRMNQRIKELAEQAKCYADENNAHYLQNQHWIETFEEKFAELIIKETLQVARAGIEFGDGMEDAVYKYFGVEE